MKQANIGDITICINDHVNAGYISGIVRDINAKGDTLMIEFTPGHTVPRPIQHVTHVNGIEVQR